MQKLKAQIIIDFGISFCHFMYDLDNYFPFFF